MLTKDQIVELREVFNFLDMNSDTMVDREDLESFLASIGSPFTSDEIDEMIEESGDKMTYMLFLTMIGERLSCTDSEKAIYTALKEFDDDDDGMIDEEMFKVWLTQKGDKMNAEDVDLLLRGCVENKNVRCKSLSSKMKYGEVIIE